MARPSKSEPSKETAPQAFPEVAPPAYAQAVGATYLVESMMQMQQAIGQLIAKTDRLIDDVIPKAARLTPSAYDWRGSRAEPPSSDYLDRCSARRFEVVSHRWATCGTLIESNPQISD